MPLLSCNRNVTGGYLTSSPNKPYSSMVKWALSTSPEKPERHARPDLWPLMAVFGCSIPMEHILVPSYCHREGSKSMSSFTTRLAEKPGGNMGLLLLLPSMIAKGFILVLTKSPLVHGQSFTSFTWRFSFVWAGNRSIDVRFSIWTR